ncbi:LemA family protein, partial [candidate division WOR-3 bacterium]|nr:LemA family protein [candidate division WOR-3 bacterium]
ELSGTENKIAFARQFYNDVVMDYNNATQMFPSNVFANMFNFNQAEFYTVPEAEREAPKVKF